MYGSEEQSHNALQRRRMNNLAIRPATIFLLASVSAFFGQISANSTLGCPPALLAAAGVSVAYVFVRTLPEMSDAQGRFHAGNCWPRIAILGTPRLLGCPDRALVLLWFD